MLREWIDDLSARLRDFIRPWLKQASTRVDPLLAQARGRYQKLEPRERILVQIAGVLESGAGAAEQAAALVDLSAQAGGADDVTVVVARYRIPGA